MNNKKNFFFLLPLMAALLTACNGQFQENYYSTTITNESRQENNNRFADYDFNNIPETIQLNENPDMSNKIMPTPYEWAEYMAPSEISDTVIPGSKLIIASAVETSDHYYSLTGNDEIDSEINDKVDGFSLMKGIDTTVEILYFQNNDFAVGDKIQIFSPGENWGENLEIGKEYLLIIHDWNDIYQYSDGMNSIFEIDDNFRVMSKSAFVAPSKLDTLSLAEAVSVLEDAIN